MKTIDRYRATVIAVLLSVALVLASHLIALDLFALVIEWLQRINTRDFHKLIFSFFLILVGFSICRPTIGDNPMPQPSKHKDCMY